MNRSQQFLIALFSTVPILAASGKDISLRLQPDASTPVFTQITATEKVLLDARPVPGEPDWQQLERLIPLEGYLPTATLSKNFEIVESTAIRLLPLGSSPQLSTIHPGEHYQIDQVDEKWSRITFETVMTGYFPSHALPAGVEAAGAAGFSAAEPSPLALPSGSEPPDAAQFDLSVGLGTGIADEPALGNIFWKSVPRSPAPIRQPQPQAIDPVLRAPELPNGIMVGPGQTQSPEADALPAARSDDPLRLLTGMLVREIQSDSGSYPVQLRSPEGRFIAFVDFSDLFINDLTPFLDQRVFIRGQLSPLRLNNGQLVIFAREIRLAE